LLEAGFPGVANFSRSEKLLEAGFPGVANFSRSEKLLEALRFAVPCPLPPCLFYDSAFLQVLLAVVVNECKDDCTAFQWNQPTHNTPVELGGASYFVEECALGWE